MNEKLIEQLSRGDFNHVELDEWFEYMHYYQKYSSYINATIEGCSKQINPDIVSFILMYAKQYYLKTKDSTSSNDIITNAGCEEILKKLIIISREQPQYKYIIKELEVFPSEIIRLYYCAYIDYHKFLEDNSPRIKKVATILNNFYKQKLTEFYTNKSLEQIRFLTSAIQYGAIQIKSLYTPTKSDEFTAIQFKSILFNWDNESINPNLMNFDVDILHTIPDKQILASIVYEWIKDGTISFKEDMTPICFKDTKSKSKTLKPNNK